MQKKERKKLVDKPKPIIQSPKPATQAKSFLPGLVFKGRKASIPSVSKEPMPVAERSTPKAVGPLKKLPSAGNSSC
ncbi:hypothetical protein D3C87_1990300 [compost metagenome]